MLRLAASIYPQHQDIRFLDPALGTGAFYSALLQSFPRRRIREAVGFEIDAQIAETARSLWRNSGLKVRLADFMRHEIARPANRFNLIVCNPPYARHHHLTGGEKARLRQRVLSISGRTISGLASLYAHFLLCSHAWASENALSVWLIPAEFMDVNYGVGLKEYLTSNVTLLRIHRFDPEDVQFEDALVSSSVVCFRNSPPPRDFTVNLTFGGQLDTPKIQRSVSILNLQPEAKWRLTSGLKVGATKHIPKLSDFFNIKRGLATGDNRFFILSEEMVREHRLPAQFLKPILPSPRYLAEDIIAADAQGRPLIKPGLFLLDCALPEGKVKADFPDLWRYLEKGKRDVANGYLCKSRSPWYSQECRPAPMFLCTYMARKRGSNGKAFRFILNHSNATAANVYLLMYPKPELLEAFEHQPHLRDDVWLWLQQLESEALTNEARIYGGGLHKLEPKELGNVKAERLASIVGQLPRPSSPQFTLLTEPQQAYGAGPGASG